MCKNFLILFLLNTFLLSCMPIKNSSLLRDNNELNSAEFILQSNQVVSSMASASRKLHDIAWQIMIANKNYCPDARINAFGIMVHSKNELDINLRESFLAASPSAKLINKQIKEDIAMVVSVASNSPAYNAGVKEGDILLSINGESYNSNYRNLLENAAENNYLNLNILRDNTEYNFILKPEVICGYPVQPMISPIPNAYADGSKIFITIATLNFVESNQELAFLIGHELAHNILHYNGNGLSEVDAIPLPFNDKPEIRNIRDVFIFQSGAKETEADMVGVEYVLRAGIKQDKAANYFRRLSIYMPVLMQDSIFRMHPGNISRAEKIDNKVRSIQ